MEQRTIRLNFDLSLVYGPRTLRAPLAAFMLLAAVGELNSESVTLSTYYPAPSGVYTNMITTGDTYLARNGGNVGIGTISPGAKLAVSGSMSVGTNILPDGAGVLPIPPANSLVVSGMIGIGKETPVQALDVVGNVVATGDVTGNKIFGNPRVNQLGCTGSSANNGSCGAGQYITWAPGISVAGSWATGPHVTVTAVGGGQNDELRMNAPPYYCCAD